MKIINISERRIIGDRAAKFETAGSGWSED